MNQDNEVQIGFKGRHYGLFKPAAVAAKPSAKPLLKKPSIFSLEDEDEPQDMKAQLASKSAKLKKAKLAAEEQAKVLQDDPTAYDYDELYDNFKEKESNRKSILDEEKKKRQPKYIKALLEKSEHRKQEQDIVYERKLRKDREVDDHMYGDKDKFVTSSYKRKLVEQQKWQEEQAKKDAQDQDVTTQKNAMFSFYSNLLDRKNVAAGSEDDAAKREAERKEEAAKKKREEEEARREKEVREREEREKRAREQVERSMQMAREAVRRTGDTNTNTNTSNTTEESKHSEKRKHADQDDDTAEDTRREETKHGEDLNPMPEQKKHKKGTIDLQLVERPKAEREAVRRNDASAVQAARERFLARKAQQRP